MHWLMDHFDHPAMDAWGFWLFLAVILFVCVYEGLRRR